MSFTIKSLFLGLLVAGASAAPMQARGASNKKGVCYEWDGSNAANGFSGSVSWGYNWGTSANGLAGSVNYVPMIKSPTADCSAVTAAIKGSSANNKYVLGYNEPDMTVAGGGCAVGASEAAASWLVQVAEFKAAGAKIGSPAVTSDNKTAGAGSVPGVASGLVWLNEFHAACHGQDQIDFVTLHWYGDASQTADKQAELFKSYISQASAEIDGLWGKKMPLWITEFAAEPATNQQVQADFLGSVMPWLEKQDCVERYSPFMAKEGYMTSGSASGAKFASTY